MPMTPSAEDDRRIGGGVVHPQDAADGGQERRARADRRPRAGIDQMVIVVRFGVGSVSHRLHLHFGATVAGREPDAADDRSAHAQLLLGQSDAPTLPLPRQRGRAGRGWHFVHGVTHYRHVAEKVDRLSGMPSPQPIGQQHGKQHEQIEDREAEHSWRRHGLPFGAHPQRQAIMAAPVAIAAMP